MLPSNGPAAVLLGPNALQLLYVSRGTAAKLLGSPQQQRNVWSLLLRHPQQPARLQIIAPDPLAGLFVVVMGRQQEGQQAHAARQVMRSVWASSSAPPATTPTTSGPSSTSSALGAGWQLELDDGSCAPLARLCATPDLRDLGRGTLHALCAELCWRTEAGLRPHLTHEQVSCLT